MRVSWPFMLRSTHERTLRENLTLRDALREANNELRKHKMLLAGIRDSSIDVAKVIEKVRHYQ